MKKWIWMATFVCFIAGLLLAGCSSPANSLTTGAGDFYTPDQVVKGGSSSETTNINIKEITTTKQNEDTVLEIKLLYGSRNSGKDEAQINNIPEYEVSCLGVPDRLLVRIKGISYYDFDETQVPNGIVQSVIKAPWIYHEYFDLYFNLSQQAAFKVQEDKDRIKITLRPTNAAPEKGFFATLDAFDEYQDAFLPEDSGFTPTICSDKQAKILISKKFNTQQDAEKFKTDSQKELSQALGGVIIRIVELASGGLPDYSSKIDPQELASIPAIKIGEKETKLDMLLQDGAYLCTAPDGTILFSRSFLTEASAADTGDEPGEEPTDPMFYKLWTSDKLGNIHPLENVSDFSEIMKAQYSPSGKYLAILEASTANMTIYTYDTVSKTISNLGEEGLGDSEDFAWDKTQDILYSISGTEENKQLMFNDFTKENHEPQALEEESVGSSRMAMGEGKLYFQDEENGQILVFDIASKVRRKLADALWFVLSPDDKYMMYFKQKEAAANNATDGETIDELVDFVLLDIATGTEKTIVQEADIPDDAYSFSADGKIIYFINQSAMPDDSGDTGMETEEAAEPTDTGEAEDDNAVTDDTQDDFDYMYPNKLFAYDIASGQLKELFMTGSEGFHVSGENKLYLINKLQNGENWLDVTYIFDPSKDYTAN